MHGRSQGNVMILHANQAVARFFSYLSFSFSFCESFQLSSSPFLFPPSASLELPSPVRVIKQLKSAFAIRRKKQRRVSVYSRLFYRAALRYTWDLAVFPSFSSENR